MCIRVRGLVKRVAALSDRCAAPEGEDDPPNEGSVALASRVESRLSRFALSAAPAIELLLAIEPVWTTAAAAFVYLSALGIVGGYTPVGLAAAALPFAARWAYRGYVSHRTPLDLPILLLMLAGLVGIYGASDKGLAWRVYETLLASVLFYYSVVNYHKPRLLLRFGLLIAAVAAIVVGGYVFLQSPTIPSSPTSLPFFSQLQSWISPHPQSSPAGWSSPPLAFNATGATIVVEVVAMLLAGVALFPGRRADRVAAGIGTLLLLGVLVISTSNAAWAVLAVGAILLLGCRSRWLLASVPALGGIVLWSVSARINRSLGPALDMVADKIEFRWHRWDSVWQMIADSPVAGVGLGEYPAAYVAYPPEDMTFDLAHNAYLQCYSDFGLLGVIALIVAAAVLLRLGLQVARAPRDDPWKGIAVGACAAVLVAAVYSMVESAPAAILGMGEGSYDYAISPLFAVVGATLVVAHRGLLGRGAGPGMKGTSNGAET
ncbi:MAG: hypothetical protein DRI39_02385 [Chloroflexi bacterium]|nr:MAG: hypothetical protein DRI39_02385 [Chloroflexota bacterium]